MKNAYTLIDMEYKGAPEKHFPLVSAAIHLMPENEKKFIWLYKNPKNQKLLKEYLEKQKDRIHVAFNVSGAEALCYLNLGLDPLDFKWIDLQLEWKQLINSWNKFFSGDHLVKGRVKKVPTVLERLKLKDHELERKYGKGNTAANPDKSLTAMTYKMLGVDVDLFYKNKMRDLIIYTDNFNDSDIKKIKDYNLSDIDEMWSLLKEVSKQVYRPNNTLKKSEYVKWSLNHALFRGRVSAATSHCVFNGYPVNKEKIENLVKNTPLIFNKAVEDIDSQDFGEFKDSLFKPLRDKEKLTLGFKYSKNMASWQNAIEFSKYKKEWPKTETGKYKLDRETLEKFYPFKYDYPQGHVFAQMLRFLKLSSALKGFQTTKNGSFFDSLGSDSRVRPFLNPYGSQTARFQPKATHMVFLKPAWLRGVVEPEKGKMIAGIDYTSQEILVAAALSKDKAMFDAYVSGDIYLFFGKQMKVIPEDGTKATHKKERDVCKAAVLGIGFGMGAEKLAQTLSEVSGKNYTTKKAKGFIEGYKKVFPQYELFRQRVKEHYRELKYPLELKCGWRLYPHNPKPNSFLNFPVQGTASTILRVALIDAIEAGLRVLFPLHDALYCEFDLNDFESVKKLDEIMKNAAFKVLGDWGKKMRTDIDLWGHGIKDAPKKFNVYQEYLDARGKVEYEMYKKYM